MSSRDSQENYLYLQSSKKARAGILKKFVSEMKVDGLYFGAEFCEHLIPSVDDLSRISDEAGIRGWKIYLMTGAAAVSVVPKYQRLLEYFAALPMAAGVVFNDWGILDILRRDFPVLEPVMGRLLFKNKRFIYRHIHPAGDFSVRMIGSILRAQIQAMRQTSFGIPEYRSFLDSLGIRKVDVDILPQGIDLKGCETLSVGAHLPLGYLTSGRTCPLWEKGSRYPSADCCKTKKCLSGGKILQDERKEFSLPLIERGNVVLYRVAKNKPEGINRWIHEVGSEDGYCNDLYW
jgi:hypothetical protein